MVQEYPFDCVFTAHRVTFVTFDQYNQNAVISYDAIGNRRNGHRVVGVANYGQQQE